MPASVPNKRRVGNRVLIRQTSNSNLTSMEIVNRAGRYFWHGNDGRYYSSGASTKAGAISQARGGQLREQSN